MARWLMGTSRGFKPQIALNLTIGVLHVVLGLAIVWVTKECIDLSVNVAHGTTDRNDLIISAVRLIVLMLTDVMLVYATRWIRALLGIRSRNRLQAEYYHRILHADWQTIHRIHSGDLTNRLTQDVETVSDFLSERLPQLITTLLQLAGAFALLCYMDWRLALVIIILTPALLGVAQLYMHRMRHYKHDIREGEAGIQGFLQETLTHSLMIKALERVDMVDTKLADKHAHIESLTRRNTRYSANATLLINLAFSIGYLTAFFWGVYRMSIGIITFGSMVAFIQLVGQIQGPMRTLTTYVSTLISVTTAGDRLMALPEAPFPPASRHPFPKTHASVLRAGENTSNGGAITIKDLTFAYEDGTPVFSDWSTTIPLYLPLPLDGERGRGKGATTAIIGRTGIGKTTLVQLLLGVLKPQSGTIEVPCPLTGKGDGGRGFAYVPQGNTLLSGTIRENLLYGNPDATDAEMEHALRLADAEFVTSPSHSSRGESNLPLSRGIEGVLGERGSGLSEGQAQRIGIARALLKDAQILLFDEAFSALDSETAVKILTAIRADRPHQTIVFVTHREALIHMADNIIRI